jgi:hypothetical protein
MQPPSLTDTVTVSVKSELTISNLSVTHTLSYSYLDMKLLILSLLVAATTGATTFKSCAGNVSPVICPVTKVTVSPDPPVAGQVNTDLHCRRSSRMFVAMHWESGRTIPALLPPPPCHSRAHLSHVCCYTLAT